MSTTPNVAHRQFWEEAWVVIFAAWALLSKPGTSPQRARCSDILTLDLCLTKISVIRETSGFPKMIPQSWKRMLPRQGDGVRPEA